MKTELNHYDIFPKILPMDKKSTIHIKPLGRHTAFTSPNYKIVILPLTETVEPLSDSGYFWLTAEPSDGMLVFSHTFTGEQEYYIRVYELESNKPKVQLSVYSLADDLFSRKPLKGDMHVHSFCSDGVESPEYVAAIYRKHGFDFMAITDHERWQPSEDAIAAYKDVNIDIKLFHGEEVHLTDNHIHIVNFGGESSVNSLCFENQEQYFDAVNQIANEIGDDFPQTTSKFEYASCMWAADKIRSCGGLAIFAHPHWLSNVYHVRDSFSNKLFDDAVFDAFELLGGQSINENAMQIAMYNDARARGLNIPIVGNSDSHGTITTEIFDNMKTIVFSPTDSKDDIISSIKDLYSAAVAQPKGSHYHVYANYRLTGYVIFLLENYFPLHDELCFEEGRLMRDYINGVEYAKQQLDALHGRTDALLEKYRGC